MVRSRSRVARIAAACATLGYGGFVGIAGSAQGAAAHGTFSIGVPAPLLRVGPHRSDMGSTPPPPSTCGCYEPAQFQAAYDLGPLYTAGDEGQGSTIVIVDSFGSPTIKSDLATFDSGFGLAAPPKFKIITPDGPIKGSNSDWALETSLDVEYSHALAPEANILLVETPKAETEGPVGFPQIVEAENYVLSHEAALGIKGGAVISQSFGATEQTFGSNFKTAILKYRTAYVNAKKAHVTVLAASGDDGATNCENAATPCTLYNMRVVGWPSSDPLVTSVGGLKLTISTKAPYEQTAAPVVWNDGAGAGGGGNSAVFGIPSFQKSVASVVGSWRGTPDVSMSASAVNTGAEIYDSGVGGWLPVGGTSEATPEFAAIVAIADQVAGKGLGDLNAALYAMESAKASGIVDVTKGNNTFAGVTGYTAVAGYDMASGIGDVDAANFVPQLVAAAGKAG